MIADNAHFFEFVCLFSSQQAHWTTEVKRGRHADLFVENREALKKGETGRAAAGNEGKAMNAMTVIVGCYF